MSLNKKKATNPWEWADGDNKVKTETPDDAEDEESSTQRWKTRAQNRTNPNDI